MKEKQPETVEQLVQLIQERFACISREVAIEYIMILNKTGNLHFREKLTLTIREYICSFKAVWYWVVLVLSIVSSLSAIIVPEAVFPIAYIRYFFGSIFVLFLPGFSLLKALFPQKQLDSTMLGILSLGMSLVIVPIVSFCLNFTYWGITVITLILSLAPFSLFFATIALIREYLYELKIA